MNEEKLLNKALEVFGVDGAGAAYAFLCRERTSLTAPGAQLYNYLYCFAALAGEREAALCHLEEAVVQRGLWYRPEVFEDEDLDSIRAEPRFIKCAELSRQRYETALKTSRPLYTWRAKRADHLAVALHGNQQNAAMCREDWAFLECLGYQTEFIQSGTVDSAGLYRWEDEDAEQISPLLAESAASGYERTVLCGFSAGCGEILKAVMAGARCDALVLASPWIPLVENRCCEAVNAVERCGAEVILLCGKQDEDCLPLAERLESALLSRGLPVRSVYLDGLAHELPEALAEILARMIK